MQQEKFTILNWLNDIRQQNACLCLYSQNYLTKTFYLNNLPDRLRQKWNYISLKLSFQKKKGKNWEGGNIVKIHQLPIFHTLGDKIDSFIRYTQEQKD